MSRWKLTNVAHATLIQSGADVTNLLYTRTTLFGTVKAKTTVLKGQWPKSNFVLK